MALSMGLMETLQYLVQLCISIQSTLNAMTEFFQDSVVLHRSLIDLSAIDVAALETNVKLLASYSEDIDYIIETLERVSGNIKLLFWILAIATILSVICLFVIVFITVYENRTKIFEWFKEKFKK